MLIDGHEGGLAEFRQKSERLRAKASRLGSRQACRRELVAVGINPRLLEAATALLLERGALDGDGYCETAHGLLPVGYFVSQFLASPRGEALQPKATMAGPFSAELARLNALHWSRPAARPRAA